MSAASGSLNSPKLRRFPILEDDYRKHVSLLLSLSLSPLLFLFFKFLSPRTPLRHLALSLSHRFEFHEQQPAEGIDASLRETGPADPRGSSVGSSSQAPAAIARPASSPDASTIARCRWARTGLRQRQRRIERAGPPRQPATIIVRLMARMKRLRRLHRTRSIDL